ncbi:MAG TPA: hypothetical protein VGS20_13055 [Candidatus Acidoferrales bacterium]|nr:hypothetical protein [Candidatus Acidoferrales bacterium]
MAYLNAPSEGRRRDHWGALICLFLIIFGVAGAGAAQKAGDQPLQTSLSKAKREPEGGEVIRRRATWFHQQRAYPLAHIPAFAREQAWQTFRQMRAAQKQFRGQRFGAALSGAATDPLAPWTSIGPQPSNDFFFEPFVSGRVSAMAVDPEDSTGNTVFLTGAQGGLWVTTDGGAHWAPAADQTQLPSLAASSLALDTSTTPPIVYVGTGEENFSIDSYYGAGVLKCISTGSLTGYSCTPDQTLGQFHAPSAANGGSAAPLNAAEGGPFVGGLAIDPINPSILLAAVQGSGSTLPSGIWCSSDAGVHWAHVLPNVLHVVGTGVVFDTDGTGYAALGTIDGNASTGETTENGVYRSSAPVSSCSISFNQLSLPAASSAMGRIALAIGPPAMGQTKGELFAAVASASDFSSTLLGVFRSLDGGATWTQPSMQNLATSVGGFCNDQCFYDLTIAVDPKDPNIVFAGGSAPSLNFGATLVESGDAGATWLDESNNVKTLTGLHVDLHAIAFRPDGGLVYVGTDGGVWSAANPASPPLAWNNRNATLALTQFYPGLALHPSGWQFLSIGGSQDNGTQTYSGMPAWTNTLACGDGGDTAIDAVTPSTVYTECEYIPGAFLEIARSLFNAIADDTQGLTSFFLAMRGIDFNDPGAFIPPLTIDPTNTQNLYFGTNRVWQTQDGANIWHALSPDVTGGASNANCGVIFDCVLSSIAVAPGNSSEIVTGSSIGHVSVTANGGQSWTDVTASPLPTRAITGVAVDPHNPNILYVTFSGFSGFNGDTAGHVFEGALTTVGTPAVAWSDISSGSCAAPAGPLPNIPVNDLVIDPDVSGRLYAATDVGVLEGNLQGGGACWQPLGTGLPNIAVLSVKLHRASRTLVAGTHGRGAWALSLGGLPGFSVGGLSPASQFAGGAAFTLTLTGTGFTSGSKVNWTPAGGATTSLGQLTATASCAPPTCIAVTVPANLIASGGSVQVAVFDSTQTPNTTNSLTFTVLSNIPTISSISPSAATAPLATNLAIAIAGANFTSNTTVSLAQLNPLPANCVATAFTSASSLTATISATQPGCLQIGGTFFVIANTPQPGGGSSNPNLLAAPFPIGGGCSAASPPGCLLTVTGPTPSNDAFANATNIASGTFSATEDTSGATPDGPTPPCVASDSPGPANGGAAKSVWFKFTPTANSIIEADTIGSDYDTILSVWTGSSVASLTNIACNDDIVSGVDRVSQVQNVSLAANTTYYFIVSAFGIPTFDANGNFVSIFGDGGKLVFNLSGGVTQVLAFTGSAGPASPPSVNAGSSASAAITFTPQAGSASGTITLQPCTSSPSTATISCSYAPNPVNLNGAAAISTVTIQTTGATPAGTYTITVPTSPAPANGAVTVQVTVTVLAFSASASVASPADVSIGSAATVTLTLTPQAGSGNGAVTLGPCTATPATTTITCAYSPNPVSLSGSPATSTVTIQTTSATAAGAYTITIPASPSPSNGGVTVQLSVGPPAFAASASAVSPSTVKAGGAATFTLSLAPQAGSANGAVMLQPCTSSPATTTITCSYSTNPLNLTGTTATTTVTIETVAPSLVPPGRTGPKAPPLAWFAVLLAVLLWFACLTRRRAAGWRPAATSAALALLVASLLMLQAACGGGSATKTPSGGTPPGSYTITVPSSPSATNGTISVAVTVQ